MTPPSPQITVIWVSLTPPISSGHVTIAWPIKNFQTCGLSDWLKDHQVTQFGPFRGNLRTVGKKELGVGVNIMNVQLSLLGCLFHLEGKACLRIKPAQTKMTMRQKET